MHSIKLSEHRTGIKLCKNLLAIEQNNYLTKIVNVYIVFDLDAWSRIPNNNFKFNNCLFEATNIVKNSDEEKYVYSAYGITFDSGGSWNFDNDFARNVVIFGVDNSSSPHSDNHKNNFLILGEGTTYGINGRFGTPGKRFDINFSKANPKILFRVWIIILIIVICLLMEKKILNLKMTIKMLTFQLNFVSEVFLMDLVLLSLEKYL